MSIKISSAVFKKNVIAHLQTIKRKDASENTIHGTYDSLAYDLIPITEGFVKSKAIIHLLASWRKKHESWFPTQFKITFSGTEKWLNDRVIHEKDRLLFMIQVNSEFIGHIGLYRFDFIHKTCEIDNIIRGVEGYPGIMSNAIATMMQWGMDTLGIKSYGLETTSDNKKAIRLYETLGFYETKRVPLIRVQNNDIMQWVNAPSTYKGSIKRYCVFMKKT